MKQNRPQEDYETGEMAGEGADAPLPFAIAIAEAGKCCAMLQVETAHGAVLENLKFAKSMLTSVADTSAAMALWSEIVHNKGRAFADLAREWFEAAAGATVEINKLMGQSLAAVPAFMQRNSGGMGGAYLIDRRVSAQVISFPDRRVPAGESGSGEMKPSLRKQG